MERLLDHVLVTRRCNACGGNYHVTLFDILRAQQATSEWKPRCEGCAPQLDSLVRQLPRERLEAVSEAWVALWKELEERQVEVSFR